LDYPGIFRIFYKMLDKIHMKQGKTEQQQQLAVTGSFIGWVGILLLCLYSILLSGCTGTYYLAQYDDHYNQSMQTDQSSITYYNNQIYWGWQSGYYYYYGKPHYYPWYYYYNTCPPTHHNTTSHVTVNHNVNRPSYRPNVNTVRPNSSGTTIKINTNRPKTRVRVISNTPNNTNPR
jgi:hypothetical protein